MTSVPSAVGSQRDVTIRLPTDYGAFEMTSYSRLDPQGLDHLAIWKREAAQFDLPLVRIHSECLTGDTFRSRRCDCGQQLDLALEAIAAEPEGILIYLRQEGRGIGLLNKLRAYNLQDQGLDTVQANEALGFAADLRDFSPAARILADLGVRQVRLITNNLTKALALESVGIRVVERLAVQVCVGPDNEPYLRTKQAKLGHQLEHLFEMNL